MDKEFALEELRIKMQEVEHDIKYIEEHQDEMDADTVGTKKIDFLTELSSLVHLKQIVETWPSILHDNVDSLYMATQLARLVNKMPLSPLYGYEDNPDEWTKTLDYLYVSKRWPYLKRFGVDVDRIIYFDISRFSFYDIIRDKNIDITDIYKFYDNGDSSANITSRIREFLDVTIPIEFPYDPINDKIKVYIEMIKCPMQDGKGDVSSIAFTHYLKKGMKRPERIMRYFDACPNGTLDEIDFKTYFTRRQIHDKWMSDKEKEAETSHENDSL